MKDFVLSLCASIVTGLIMAAVYSHLPTIAESLPEPRETLICTVIVANFIIFMLTIGAWPHVAGYAVLSGCGHISLMYATNGTDTVSHVIIAGICYALASLAVSRTLDTPQTTDQPPE